MSTTANSSATQRHKSTTRGKRQQSASGSTKRTEHMASPNAAPLLLAGNRTSTAASAHRSGPGTGVGSLSGHPLSDMYQPSIGSGGGKSGVRTPTRESGNHCFIQPN